MSFLAAPTDCHYCASTVVLIEARKLFLMDAEPSPLVYFCTGCGARIGVHAGTKIPLGMIADAETRKARIEAHAAFDELWMSGKVGRFKGYAWLAHKLGIEHAICHIGWMDAELCKQVVEICAVPPTADEVASLRSRRPWRLQYRLRRPLGIGDMKKSHHLMQGKSHGKAKIGGSL